MCGVYGLKATFGRISGKQDTTSLCYTIGHVGPTASSTLDLLLVYSITAGPEKDDIQSFWQPSVSRGLQNIQKSLLDNENILRGLRIGIYHQYFFDSDPEISGMCYNVVKEIYQDKYGAQLVDLKIPLLEEARIAHIISIVGEMLSGVSTEWNDHELRKNFITETRILLTSNGPISSAQYVHSQRIRTHMMKIMEEIFKTVDVIVTPTIPITAPTIYKDALAYGESDTTVISELMRYMFLANFTGIPAISIPIGLTEKGKLPVGLQLMAPWWMEETLFKFSFVTEKEIKPKKPPVFFSYFN